ncbi:hypothetical protein Dimus_020815 [Dionaea muscipula]
MIFKLRVHLGFEDEAEDEDLCYPEIALAGIMQQSTNSSHNTTVDVASGYRSCCGHLGLEAWVSHTTRNYNRPYWRCKHCGDFVCWVEADLVIELKELSSTCVKLNDEFHKLHQRVIDHDAALTELRESLRGLSRRFMIAMTICMFSL